MKQKIYRLSLIFLILVCIAFDAYLLVDFIKMIDKVQESLILQTLATIVLIAFSIFEIILLMKGLKKEDFIIRDLVFEGKEINKPSFIINNILLAIGIICFITTLTCAFIFRKNYYSLIIMVPIFLFLILNCAYYNFYILLDKSLKKDFIKDLNFKK